MLISKIYRNSPLYVLVRTIVGELYHGTERLSTRISKFVCLAYPEPALKIAAGCGILCIVNDVRLIRWA